MTTFVRVNETFRLLNASVAPTNNSRHDLHEGPPETNGHDDHHRMHTTPRSPASSSTTREADVRGAFHSILHARRIDARISIGALARAVGMDDAKVAAIERGDEVPSDEMAIRLLAAL